MTVMSLLSPRRWHGCWLGARFQNHHRSFGRPQRRIGVQLFVNVAPPGPQARSFLPLGSACPHRSGSLNQIDRRVGMRLQIEPPGWLGISPAVHRKSDHIRTILEVADDDASLLARATPDCRETRSPPSAALWTPQPHAATAHAEYRAVRRPGEANEPARRQARSSLAIVGHKAPFGCQPGHLLEHPSNPTVLRGTKGANLVDELCAIPPPGCRGPRPCPNPAARHASRRRQFTGGEDDVVAAELLHQPNGGQPFARELDDPVPSQAVAPVAVRRAELGQQRPQLHRPW
jgi:hypothetical protein